MSRLLGMATAALVGCSSAQPSILNIEEAPQFPIIPETAEADTGPSETKIIQQLLAETVLKHQKLMNRFAVKGTYDTNEYLFCRMAGHNEAAEGIYERLPEYMPQGIDFSACKDKRSEAIEEASGLGHTHLISCRERVIWSTYATKPKKLLLIYLGWNAILEPIIDCRENAGKHPLFNEFLRRGSEVFMEHPEDLPIRINPDLMEAK